MLHTTHHVMNRNFIYNLDLQCHCLHFKIPIRGCEIEENWLKNNPHLFISLCHQILHGVLLLQDLEEPDDLVIGPVRVPVSFVVEPVTAVAVGHRREEDGIVFEKTHFQWNKKVNKSLLNSPAHLLSFLFYFLQINKNTRLSWSCFNKNDFLFSFLSYFFLIQKAFSV